jgi:O-Antigen ligase
MPSARLPELGVRGSAIIRSGTPGARAGAGSRAPAALGVALLLICLYAAFDHGAVGPAGEERLQLALSAVAAPAMALWLWGGALRLSAPGIVWIAVGLLAAFALWSGVTLAWSVAPDQTWAECNRAIGYVLALVLAVALGSSDRRAPAMVAHGFLAVGAAVTVYALAQKLLPGLHVAGVFDLNTTGTLPRLQEPLGYWNALALLVAMAAPVAFSLALQRGRPAWMRMAAIVLFVLMLQTIAFTYSRGGVLGLVVALAVAIAIGGARLRCLLWLAMSCLAGAPAVTVGLMSHPLTSAGISLGTRERAGLELVALLFACLLLLVLGARRAIELERHVRISEGGARRVGRAIAASTAAILVVALLAVALSGRGLEGTVSHAWHSFTTTRATSVSDPARLLSADSENRWVWWKEAAGAFSDRPLGGWGAGSFGVVHLLYRRDTLSVQQPHSVPLQFLAETGIVGATLALLGLALLLAGAVRAVRQRRTADGRLIAAGLLAGAAAYAVHELYDWDWDIPAVSLPALVLLGTLVGGLGRRIGVADAFERARRPADSADCAPADTTPAVRTPAVRALGVAAGTLCLAAFAFSAVVPRLAAREAAHALVAASSSSATQLRLALADALAASRLDPVSDAGLRAASTIAVHMGRPGQARRLLLQALRREPTDGQAWQQLAYEDFAIGVDQEGVAAAQRAQALDPRGTSARALAQGALLEVAPPAGSATAVRTPGGP